MNPQTAGPAADTIPLWLIALPTLSVAALAFAAGLWVGAGATTRRHGPVVRRAVCDLLGRLLARPTPAAVPLAPTRRFRHLTLIPSEPAPPVLYDWRADRRGDHTA